MSALSDSTPLPPVDALIRGQRVILDNDLATLYGIPTSRFNEAIKRNRSRFPEDFMFQHNKDEQETLTSQIAILKPGRGGRRTLPFAFTEHGALQAANVLKSGRAEAMSLYLIRAFVSLRAQLSTTSEVLRRLSEMDRKLVEHDDTLAHIRHQLQPLLNQPAAPPRRRIGFHQD